MVHVHFSFRLGSDSTNYDEFFYGDLLVTHGGAATVVKTNYGIARSKTARVAFSWRLSKNQLQDLQDAIGQAILSPPRHGTCQVFDVPQHGLLQDGNSYIDLDRGASSSPLYFSVVHDDSLNNPNPECESPISRLESLLLPLEVFDGEGVKPFECLP